MNATINNGWIALTEKKNGITVERKYGGHSNLINHEDDTVAHCIVYYWQRELYPDNTVNRVDLKTYSLQDLPYTEVVVEGVTYYMEPLAVLTGFIMGLGQPNIVDPARDTLENTTILPLTAEEGYPLRRDTRTKILKEA